MPACRPIAQTGPRARTHLQGYAAGRVGPQRLTRMAPGDGILIYSPRTTYPPTVSRCEPSPFVGEITGDEPEPSNVIPGGFRRVIEPLPLGEIREHMPVARFRFGFFERDPPAAEAIWLLVAHQGR